MRFLAASLHRLRSTPDARVVELVDTGDLKSPDLTVVPVQFRPRAPFLNTKNSNQNHSSFKFCRIFKIKFNLTNKQRDRQ